MTQLARTPQQRARPLIRFPELARQQDEEWFEHHHDGDLLEEAAHAAERDRPDAYEHYLVTDLCELSAGDSYRLREANLSCLCTVAALGFGDIPPRAFATAFNHVRSPGWLAMSIKGDFLASDDTSGFSQLLRAMMSEGLVSVESQFRYCHRLSLAGEKLFYVGVIGRKLRDIPDDILDALQDSPQRTAPRLHPPSHELITDTHQRSSS